MKEKMIKLVNDNFEIIKNNFYNSELEILEMIGEDEGEDMSEDIEFLKDQLNISTTEELIGVINIRSLNIDLDNGEELDDLLSEIENYL